MGIRKMRRIITTIFSVLLLSLATTAGAQNIEDKRYVCMMQDSLQVKAGEPIEIAGNTYYGCCSMCAGNMKANPEKYTKAKDPVTGVTVDKSQSFIFAHEGSAFYFETASNREKFASNPQEYIK